MAKARPQKTKKTAAGSKAKSKSEPAAKSKKTAKTKAPPKSKAKKDGGNGRPFTPEELQVVRELLLQKRRELTNYRDTQLRELTTGDKHHLADLEEMADTVETDSFCELIDIGTSTVEQIDLALEKIAQGTYGICEVCEQPIGRARLEALPFAGLCVECQRKKERNELETAEER